VYKRQGGRQGNVNLEAREGGVNMLESE